MSAARKDSKIRAHDEELINPLSTPAASFTSDEAQLVGHPSTAQEPRRKQVTSSST